MGYSLSGMSFHLHFVNQNQPFDFDFEEQENASSKTVSIQGKNYALLGDETKISWIKSKLPDLYKEGISISNLIDRLQEVKVDDLILTPILSIEHLHLSERVIKKALSFFPDTMSGSEKLKFLKVLLEDENKRKLEKAIQTPLPGMPEPKKSFPNDNDEIEFPSLISDLTWREAMFLGTILTIFGMNDALKAACIKSCLHQKRQRKRSWKILKHRTK